MVLAFGHCQGNLVGPLRSALTATVGDGGANADYPNPHPFLLRATAGPGWRARRGNRAHSVERRQASGNLRPVTCAMMGFLARWAHRLSWRETARSFQTSWEVVYRSVEWFVHWGLAHRQLRGVESIGVDEIHRGRGLRADNFLTVIYQIDAQCRRLLWVGRRCSQATLRRGLKTLGPEVAKGLCFVCSDMWKPYLQVIAAQAGQVLHVLDRFHITSRWNEGYREHLLLALEAKADRSAAMDELKSLLAGDISSAGGGRVMELLQAVQGSSDR